MQCKRCRRNGQHFSTGHRVCKSCRAKAGRQKYPEMRSTKLSQYQSNSAQILSRLRTKKYGLSENDFRSLVNDQNNQCAICRYVFTSTPCVDHDHQTGSVRGLLCADCNRGLGLFKDNSDHLESAIEYLKTHAAATASPIRPVCAH